ncbi:MAG: hypothetical protein WA971_01625 [Microbacterium sp.]
MGVGAVVVIVVILWLDIATGLWQNLVILSGLASGLVTFLLTAVVLNRLLARSTERRWAPVNRLAFSEFLHALADDERSEISRGEFVSRSLTLDEGARGAAEAPLAELERLRQRVVVERGVLSDVLSRWAQFLASSGDNEEILQRIAAIAWQLDRVRDAALDAERDWTPTRRDALTGEIDVLNGLLARLAEELGARLAAPATTV